MRRRSWLWLNEDLNFKDFGPVASSHGAFLFLREVWMSERDLYRSVAKVTGEDIERLRRMGFRIKVIKARKKRPEILLDSELVQAVRLK